MLLRLSPAAALLCIVAGCRHDVLRFAHDGERDGDAGTSGKDADLGPTVMTDGGASLESDAGDPFPYRWLVNTPGEGKEEGALTVELDCVRDGRLIPDCVLGCALDRPDYIACRDHLETYMDPGDHRLCVRVQAPATDVEFAGQSLVQCVPWTTLPYGHPFMWQALTPDPRSTALDLPLHCAQEPALDSGSVVRSDCQFTCSLDHMPYRNCTGNFQASVKPGSHELRVITCGPLDHESQTVCRPRLLKFDIDADALPEVPYEAVPEAALLEREQLGKLAALIDPYVAFAEACGNGNAASVHEQAIRSYLSYVQLRIANVKDAPVQRCRDALEARPAGCVDLPGTSTHYREDIMLRERLPFECHGYWGSGDELPEIPGVPPGDNGLRCITHAECSGACERADAWVDFQRTWGYCGANDAAEEGIMCRTRGCQPEHLYCGKGACLPRNPVGTPCQRSREGLDCQEGLTCTVTTPSVCAAPVAGIGEACAFPSDCKEGVCDLEQRRCVEAATGEP
jgi:hypothetical protein